MRKILLFLFLASCTPSHPVIEQEPDDEKVYINIDGNPIEMVADDYGNQYLKEPLPNSGSYLYIPFPFETEEEKDSVKVEELLVKKK